MTSPGPGTHRAGPIRAEPAGRARHPTPPAGLREPAVAEAVPSEGRPMRTLSSVLVCFGIFWGAWAVSVADIKASPHVSDGQFGLLLSAALLAAAATNAVAGSLAERWGTTTTLSRCLTAWAVLLVAGAAVGPPVAFGAPLVGGGAWGG